MRWDGQRVGSADEQALPGLPGLVRSVRTPEFAGMVFHEVLAKSVLNRVPGGSPMPFQWTVNPYRGCSHACSYCLHGDTPILMADGSTKPISALRVGDRVYGTQRRGSYRHYVPTEVRDHWSTVKPAYRVTLEDGTSLIASGDHRFLTERGWKHVTGTVAGPGRRPHLTAGNKLMGTGRFAAPPKDTADYRRGYLCGIARGDGGGAPAAEIHARVAEYLTGDLAQSLPVPWPQAPTDEWRKGLLAGVFDSDGTFANRIVRFRNLGAKAAAAVLEALAHFGFHHAVEERRAPEGRCCVRVDGGLAEHLRLFHTIGPAVAAKRTIDDAAIKSAARLGVVEIQALGIDLPLFDITTGTGDFIADGVVSHNCFARRTHNYLDLDAGHDFDSQIVVKVNAAEVLAKQLRAPRWTREHVAMGTNTDPYQRAEGRYALMPGIIRALADSGTPFSILTKGTVLSRDLPLLTAVSSDVPVGVGVSIALLDRELQRGLEPGTASPQARLELVRRITDAGLPCAVFVAPVLPGLTDTTEQLDSLLTEIAAAGATGVTVLPLHLRPGAKEWFAKWLARDHPALVPLYRRIYGSRSTADIAYRRALGTRVGPLLRAHGFAGQDRAEPSWPRGSLPSPTEAPLVQEQLTLL
ncbi:intein C-terminal splicing region/intein N-terminal splicing region [Actinokineospora alba]|uniref:Intein C-terminal splicing region/intein N-terminal splicing region n=1 Tax=Actinokineospora alba TaxID=504798 RepID=A0A1H0TM47_9PSEU|nr:intein-containing Rv2578c family radical SAM protein [Actinokineospora alba]TDP70599.1 intein/intein [Actinokineospora alba]SDJ11327.1 intein C-terminal splicing region/intein N-terminal splicing region [Actinokineospora alba]SDP55059.1 intein C-terminal splicing region/intein N-terminal splicing region [Actinokineospora alba]